MKKIFITSIFLFFTATIFAQQTSFINIKIPDSKTEGTVRLKELSAEAEVYADIAVTKLDMIIENTTASILEGEIEFPLGENESVTGYALDIDGRMRNGVVVEKEKGRQIFEAVVRQGIDPGLVEKTAGNNFKTRVYPIPANGVRHLQITYQTELKNTDRYIFSALPENQLDSFDFKITILKNNALMPKELSDKNTFSFSEMNTGITATISKKNYKLTSPIIFEIPSETSDVQDVYTEDIGSSTYFYFSKKIKAEPEEKTLPEKLTVWWDISSSGEKRNIEKEIQLLETYAARLDNPEIMIVPFCNEVHNAKVFTGNSKQELKKLRDFILSLEYDGATNLDVDFNFAGGDELLIFTDGLSSWKDGSDIQQNISVPVYTINSSPSADHSRLKAIAEKNSGAYINLSNPSADVSYGLKKLLENPLRLIKIEYNKKAVEEIFPSEKSIVDENFSVAGILKKKEADVTLYFGHGTKIENSFTVKISAPDTIQTKNIARQWAIKKINFLNEDYKKNKQQIIETAKKFGIVTDDTSLIVLDTAEDYVRYNVIPPKEDEKLYRRYSELIKNSNNNSAKNNREENSRKIPETVYKDFEAFRKWWNTSPEEFKKKTNLKNKDESDSYEIEPPVLSRLFSAGRNNERENYAAESAYAFTDSLSLEVELEEKEAFAENPSAQNKEASIQLEAWSPDADYLSVLKRTKTNEMYKKYLELKKEHSSSPSFYIAVSDYFAQENLSSESLRILSNLAELNLESTDILRALADKLVEHKYYKHAIQILEKLVTLKSEIPQFLRDLGMAYYLNGEYQKAVDTLYSVAYKHWDGRFAEVQQIALNDMNAIIAECRQKKIKLNLSDIDKKLIQNFDCDIRIILTWNMDDCDIDLWVTDPDEEKCYYGNKLTALGGRISNDFTQGYGPEEFCIHEAPEGTYKIEANYYANHQQKILQPVTVQAEIYTNFGRPDQKRQVLTLELTEKKETFLIGTVNF
ncbi:VIT domain-containing protein [Treponema sp.]|uniref:VIT domain-containing protein n=1 Tax=Treponema sp. TaxID=166 RepID=UPI00257F6CD7|nr:VIT domain-containing protein [Treponema sp.]